MQTNHSASLPTRGRTAPLRPAQTPPPPAVQQAATAIPPATTPAQCNEEGLFDLAEILGEAAEEIAQEETPLEVYHAKRQGLLTQIQESSDQIREAAAQFEQFYPEPRPVPSTLGCDLQGARKRLGQNELALGTVKQEYSDKVARGCIISQVPSPGGRINKNSGVRVVISKGPPPDKEKHQHPRKQDTLKGPHAKSRHPLDQPGDGLPDAAALSTGDPTLYL